MSAETGVSHTSVSFNRNEISLRSEVCTFGYIPCEQSSERVQQLAICKERVRSMANRNAKESIRKEIGVNKIELN